VAKTGRSLYLVNPSPDYPTYFGAEVYAALGFQPATLIADLALPTLAALAPDDIRVELCDEIVTPVDLDHGADCVGLTGKITQWHRMRALAEHFRARGKIVLIGGPYASLCPETVRPHCDILVRGEAEHLFAQVMADVRNGTWKPEYVGDRPDLADSPIPRWEAYPNDRAVMGTVQTSRGCPFECEFCDVIQYLGRKQRHKPVTNVLRELDRTYAYGYRRIFLADDNFTVYRSRAKELLEALRDWNAEREDGPVRFLTQVSIDAAKDEELLRMCADAGLTQVFIGIETVNEASLRESKKRQNVGVDLVNQIHAFIENGISVIGGMIVGFDADGPDIFERQYEFAMATGVPIFSLGALVAPAATPLHARMEREGRLVAGESEVAAVVWSTNITPKLMTREQLLDGVRWLGNRLYAPEAFGERMLRFIDRFGRRRPRAETSAPTPVLRSVEEDGLGVLAGVPKLGAREQRMWSALLTAVPRNPATRDYIMAWLAQYRQVRYMYDRGRCWDALPAGAPPPTTHMAVVAAGAPA
jgi:radical SAM superfamily enzyme YgiQ (UPF0313 family)